MKQKEITEDDRRQAMESLDQLIKSAEGFKSEFSRFGLIVATEENKLESLTSKRKLLESDIAALEQKRNTVDLDVKEERKSVIAQIESDKNAAAKLKEEALDIKNKTELRESQAARSHMEAISMKEQYEAQLADLNREKETVNAKKKEVEEFLERFNAKR